jgi:cell wall-associated NlpC family hydrolase
VLLTTVAAVADNKYTVRRGDTLKAIAKKHGVSEKSLRKVNGLETANHLRGGQVLQIPAIVGQSIGSAELLTATAMPHSGPFQGSKSLDAVSKGDKMPALAETGGWVKVLLPSGAGWLPKEAVKVTPTFLIPTPALPAALKLDFTAPKSVKAPVKKVASIRADAIVKTAFAYQGVRYRWGGTSRSGVDCSGFTSTVFRSHGIKLPRTAISQSHVGTYVPSAELRKGDLVFFRTSRSIRVNHVGLYIGNRNFLHAATGAGHVMVSNLDEKYYRRCYATARRIGNVGASL